MNALKGTPGNEEPYIVQCQFDRSNSTYKPEVSVCSNQGSSDGVDQHRPHLTLHLHS